MDIGDIPLKEVSELVVVSKMAADRLENVIKKMDEGAPGRDSLEARVDTLRSVAKRLEGAVKKL